MLSVGKIAEELGINASTVSRALNNRYGVSEKTRSRVLERVNQLASAGASRRVVSRPLRCRVLGVVLPGCSSDFFGRMIAGIESSASAAGDMITLGCSQGANTLGGKEREARLLEEMCDRGVDGIILTTVNDTGRWAAPARVVSGAVPIVLADREIPGVSGLPAVLWDERQGATEVAELLLNLGHQHIAFVKSAFRFQSGDSRVTTIVEVLRSRGVPEENLRILPAELEDAGRSTAIRVLHESPRPTVLVLNDDSMASRVYGVLSEFGLVPGKDIAVVSFGDQAIAPQLHVPLTSVRQNTELMGRMCVEMLHERLDHPLQPPRTLRIATPLIMRQSCGALRKPDATRT